MVDIYVGPENTHWVLHEKLLCTKSPFFKAIFYNPPSKSPASKSSFTSKALGLPEEEDEPFRLFVSWLYSTHIPFPTTEKDLGELLDLYLMGEKWQISELERDVMGVVRRWYRETNTYPGLRRVQYVYANTTSGSAMRETLTGMVAQMLVFEGRDEDGGNNGRPEKLLAYWERALAKNGAIAVDLLRAVKGWGFERERVPDMRLELEERKASSQKNRDEAPPGTYVEVQTPTRVVATSLTHGSSDAKALEADDDVETLVNSPGNESNAPLAKTDM
jgi:hypothetical protein